MSSAREFLGSIYARYHHPDFLGTDPLAIVHEYESPKDQEVVAIISALLAYGGVKQIQGSIREALRRMKVAPARFIGEVETDPKTASQAFRGWTHRFNTGEDLASLCSMIAASWRKHGSVGAHFLSFHSRDEATVELALRKFIQEWKAMVPPDAGVNFLLNSPGDGSCCKRWCMLLRWMGRRDEIDLGLWSEPVRADGIRADQLMFPLDTHTGRLSQRLGFTTRKTLNWKAVCEVTEALKEIAPEDPSRFDFSLSRLGMLNSPEELNRILNEAAL